jgi:hypothetical protein
MNTWQLPENTLMERLRAFYIEGREISDFDKKIKERWEAAHSLILSSENDRNAAKIISKRFDITVETAYQDIRNSTNLFGDVRRASKEGLRHIVTQWATDLHRKAVASNNFKAAEKAMERITKVNNLDKEDQDIPDPSKIQPPVQLLSVNFTFINTPMFKLIDETAQKAILQLYDEFMEQVKISPLAEYTDMFKIDDSARQIGNKHGSTENQ